MGNWQSYETAPILRAEFIQAVTENVRQETGLELLVWTSTMSPDFGTTMWSTFVDDLGRLEEADDKLMVSDSFLALTAAGFVLLCSSLLAFAFV